MDSEAKIIIAFLFNRSGKTELKEFELYLPLSMELGWLSTKESQEFVKYAIKQGLLVRKEGMVLPSFSLENIAIPVGFTPSKRLFSEEKGYPQESVIDSVITRICTQTNQSRTRILEEISQEEKEKHLLPEIAALYIARRYGVDTREWHDAIEIKLLTGNTG
jgi:hypothetical protein